MICVIAALASSVRERICYGNLTLDLKAQPRQFGDLSMLSLLASAKKKPSETIQDNMRRASHDTIQDPGKVLTDAMSHVAGDRPMKMQKEGPKLTLELHVPARPSDRAIEREETHARQSRALSRRRRCPTGARAGSVRAPTPPPPLHVAET
eukprot:6202304-Pleurochrysis_carterae.AAC.1